MNKNLLTFLFLSALIQLGLAEHTTTKVKTSVKTHTTELTKTLSKGNVLLTVYEDIYDYTTLWNTQSPDAVTRKSASSTLLVTTLPLTLLTKKSSTSSGSLATLSVGVTSAKTTTSMIFSAKSSAPSSTVTGTGITTVTTNASQNPLVTQSIIVSTSKSATINTQTLVSAKTIATSASTKESSSQVLSVTTAEATKLASKTSTSGSSSVVSSSASKVASSSSSGKITSSSSSATKVAVLAATSSSTSSSNGAVSTDPSDYTGDLFEAIDTNSPPAIFERDELYLDLAANVDNGDKPYGTNKFYTNMMLDTQDDTVFVYPYSAFWLSDTYYGLAVAHTSSSQYVYGNHTYTDYAGYYFNPLKVGQLVFSASSFDSSATLSLSDMNELSAVASLAESGSTTSYVEFPLVEGMGFVTGIYHGSLVPEINSQIGIDTFTTETSASLADGILKYRATLYNDVEWLIYVTLPDGYTSSEFHLTSSNSNTIKGSSSIDGLIIQVAISPSSSVKEVYYDQAAGMYATSAEVSGSVTGGSVAEYLISYTTSGQSSSGSTMVFALPHHVSSLTALTSVFATGIELDSTTKGKMYGYLTNTLSMSETLETGIMFLPWSSDFSELSYTSAQLKLIADAANSELDVDIEATVAALDSNYYSGKVIDKYAYILLTVSEIIQDDDTTQSTLEALKTAFKTFTENNQYYPLFYDTKYKGVTSTASQAAGDSGLDFGASIYNDHHFHYGYFVHAAAVVGYVDSKYNGTWAEDNKDWVNSLIRDVANPSSDDSYFPVSRMFDWYQGHSWAAGLASAGDGKNQESSSEDYNFAYGMKLWGRVIGDQSMESRGDLMLAISKRSMNDYYLYSDDNAVEPSDYTPNRVAGILFDNKIDYTTYFGSNIEYIHGIHMLPITPASSLVRGSTFSSQEWSSIFSSTIDSISSGWTGILRLNQALFDPSTSYSFFSSSDFSSDYLDNGQSLTWCLAFSGGLTSST